MRIRLACSLALALVVITSAESRAELADGSVTLTLKTPKKATDHASITLADYAEPTADVKPRQFNRAHCECDEGSEIGRASCRERV